MNLHNLRKPGLIGAIVRRRALLVLLGVFAASAAKGQIADFCQSYTTNNNGAVCPGVGCLADTTVATGSSGAGPQSLISTEVNCVGASCSVTSETLQIPETDDTCCATSGTECGGTGDTACCSGLVCLNGQCGNQNNNGGSGPGCVGLSGACGTGDTDCCTPYDCLGGTCQAACATNDDCTDGQVCLPNGNCSNPGTTGSTCGGNNPPCGGGLTCTNGVCVQNSCDLIHPAPSILGGNSGRVYVPIAFAWVSLVPFFWNKRRKISGTSDDK